MQNERPVESAPRLERKALKRKTVKRTLLVMLGLIVLTVAMFAFMLFGPSVPIVVSRKTTYLTEPLDKYGQVDYFEALRREQKQGITVDNNAAVLLWQAWGRMELHPRYVDAHFDELGIPVPPADGDYLITVGDDEFVEAGMTWLESVRDATSAVDAGDIPESQSTSPRGAPDRLNLPAEFDALIGTAMRRPWRAEDVPPLAVWLQQNEKPIELIFEATKQPGMYAPMVRPAPDGEYDTTLIELLLPTAQNCRDAARALAMRSMWHLGEGRIDDAWNDAMACHRLARLIAQGPTLVGQLVAIAIDDKALQLDQAILEQPLTAEQVEMMRRDLSSLAPCSNMARTIDRSERFMFLDAVAAVARGAYLGEFAGDGVGEIANRLSVDWNVPLQVGNECYDEVVAAASLPRFADRQAALQKAEARLRQLAGDSMPQRFAISLFSRDARSDLIGSVFITMFLPAVQAATSAEDRSNTDFALTIVAVELAAHHAKHGEYPAKLEDLGENIVTKLPHDLFSEQPFLYIRRGQEYLLYSVGPNQRDDRGSNSRFSLLEGIAVEEGDAAKLEQIDPNADDSAIRLPRPPFSWSERIAEAVRIDNGEEGAALAPPEAELGETP